MDQDHQAICFSRGLKKSRAWQRLLSVGKTHYVPPLVADSAITANFYNNATLLVDWGNKRESTARRHADASGLPLLRLEDGFIRSISPATTSMRWASRPFSIIVDDLGIYYDARYPSRLECWLNNDNHTPRHTLIESQPELDDPALLARAGRLIERILSANISKFNDSEVLSPERLSALLGEASDRAAHRVLVVDQVQGDLSIAGALADSHSFDTMLASAMSEFPESDILIKTHPAFSDNKGGHFSEKKIQAIVADNPAFEGRLICISEPVNIIALLKQVDQVYVVSSQVGFEALLLQKTVNCFGVPFYAGWGLTHDRQSVKRRTTRVTLASLFAAAYLCYTHYQHPLSGKACELEDIVEFVALQRSVFTQNAAVNLCLGFPPWKRAYLRRFLYSPWGETHFFRSAGQLEAFAEQASVQAKPTQVATDGHKRQSRAIIWGNSEYSVDRNSAVSRQLRVEDGFIRSVGLGKYYIPPVSLVFDQQGIYFDPEGPSELESLLNTCEFSEAQLQSATRLIDTLTKERMTKYNVGGAPIPDSLKAARNDGKTVVLVPGQVEDDASISAACNDVCTDADLLQAAREARPEAVIVYKPHPDVVSGNMRNASGGNIEKPLFDICIEEVAIEDCLDWADEVHTMTSLTGFEALIRDKKVVTYGLPFYAGWGLTEDAMLCSRRTRQRSLAELVAAVFLLYSRYLDYRSGYFLSAEQALDALIETRRAERSSAPIQSSAMQRFYLKLRNLFLSLLYGWRFK